MPQTRLRAWRTQQGMTLEDLAGLSGFSRAHISFVERSRKSMSPAGKVRLARALGVKVSDLFEPDSGAA